MTKSSRYVLGVSNMGALNPAYLGHFRGAANPLYLGHLRGVCSGPSVNRASPDTLLGAPLSMRVLEVPAWKRPIHTGLRAALFKDQTIYSGSTLPKDKAVSRRQTIQYGKARSTRQRSILAKEAAISERRGVAWRKQGLDCLSASELIKPATKQHAARGLLRLGVAFLC